MALPLRRFGLSLAAFVLLASSASAEDLAAIGGEPTSALARYVSRPEPAYGWTLKEKTAAAGVTIYKLELTSQTWQDIVWKHVLHVYEPQDVKIQDHALLFVSGGSRLGEPRAEENLIAMGLANLCGGRVALLKQVPNQPLFDDRVEDDLITETWLRYLQTGDQSWPLLFPMVKSAVKAMDAVSELGQKEGWPQPIEKFVITGASKRGWTSWLTPVADPRVVATAPLVIDTLNFRAQMDYQVQTWGEFSEQIQDYTSKGLVRAKMDDESPRETALRTMMDPWTYRERLTIPKLMINGTNDRYWVVDASRNYYGDLVGHKNVLEIPNAGHGLDGGLDKVTATIAVLFRRAAHGKTLPALDWQWDGAAQGESRVLVTSTEPAKSSYLWAASSPTNDFREAKWSERPMSGRGDRYEGKLGPTKDAESRVAVFAELRFVDRTIEPPVSYSLTTTVKTFFPKQIAAGE